MKLFALLFALATAVGVVVMPVPVHAASTFPTTASFAPASSGVLKPGQDLVLSGELSNPTGSAVPAGTATVYLDATPVSSTGQLVSWLGATSPVETAKLGSLVSSTQTPEVPAGRTVAVTITVPASAITLSAWGARTVAVNVTTAAGSVGQSRTVITWFPTDTVPVTQVALAVPITVPPNATGLISPDDLASYTSSNGLLTRELDQVTGRNVALGIDPMILASIRVLGTSAPLTAQVWLARLSAMTNETFALTYADTDLAAATQAGVNGILVPTSFTIDASLFPGATTPTPTPTGSSSPVPTTTAGPVAPLLPTVQTLTAWQYTVPGIAWPADNTVIEDDLDDFAKAQLTTTLLSSENVTYSDTSYTQNSPTTVAKHAALVSDATVSRYFRSAAAATDELSWSSAMSGLAAAVATISRERPAEARTLLATLGRTSPEANFRLGQTIDTLNTLPWVHAAGFADLAAAASNPGISATITAKPEPAERVQAAEALLSSEAKVSSFSSILTDPTVLTGERRLALMGVLANSWSSDAAGWKVATGKYEQHSSDLVESVKIADTSSFVLTSARSNLPITVSNKLAWPVTVFVTVRSPNGSLNVVDKHVQLTLEADSQAKALVPVESLANGDVTVEATLSSATNVAVGSAAFFSVDVQAGWETVLTAVVAVLVVGVFGFGIWRNIAKRRKAKRLAAEPAADPETSE